MYLIFSPYFRTSIFNVMKVIFRSILFFLLSINFFGSSAQNKAPVHVFELGQKITEHLVNYFPGSLVKAAWRVNTNSVLSYEIRLMKANLEYTLVYDKDGKFLRKETVIPLIPESKPVIHRKLEKAVIMQPLDALPIRDSLILRY
jgi:hypothetical protein